MPCPRSMCQSEAIFTTGSIKYHRREPERVEARMHFLVIVTKGFYHNQGFLRLLWIVQENCTDNSMLFFCPVLKYPSDTQYLETRGPPKANRWKGNLYHLGNWWSYCFLGLTALSVPEEFCILPFFLASKFPAFKPPLLLIQRDCHSFPFPWTLFFLVLFFCVWGILCPTCASSLRPLLASSFPSNILILSFFFFLFQGANIINSIGTWAELRWGALFCWNMLNSAINRFSDL